LTTFMEFISDDETLGDKRIDLDKNDNIIIDGKIYAGNLVSMN